MRRVYLDNAATTPIDPRVTEVMIPFMENEFGNPSSTHFFGRQTKAAIERTRRKIASLLHVSASEIIFTSGGTEADNMALRCAVKDLNVKTIITSPIEHHAVLHTVEDLARSGDVQMVTVPVLENGHIDLDALENLLEKHDHVLVSLMHGNNEIGNLLPLQKVSKMCRQHNAFFHSDTVQTMGHYELNLQELDIDFITCAGHKFHGPKGVGFLYVNKKLNVKPIIQGGAQERGLRGGTENIYGIIGLGKAMEIAHENMQEHHEHVQNLKSKMIRALKAEIPGIDFHGDITPEKSLYTVLNVCFPPSEKGEMLLFTLDINGVAVSGGSACSSGATTGSHVLKGIGADMSRPNARFSFSRFTTEEDVDYAIEVVLEAFKKAIPINPS